MSHRSPKRAMQEIIRQEAENHTGRPMTKKAAKKWLRKQPRNAPALHVVTPFRWPQVATLPTLYRGMAAMVRKSNPVPFGWGRLEQPGLAEGIQMPLWFWWGMNAIGFLKSLPVRIGLRMLGWRRNA